MPRKPLSFSNREEHPNRQRLLWARGVLIFVAGVSVGSVLTRALGAGIDLSGIIVPQQEAPEAVLVTAPTTRALESSSAATTEKNVASNPANPAVINTHSKPRKKFYEMAQQVTDRIHQMSKVDHFAFGNTAYNRANVVQSAPWLERQYANPRGNFRRKICRETCCVEPIAISLQQDQHQIIHCRDGIELADTMVAHYGVKRQAHLEFHASHLQPEILPCIVPGTIILVENHGHSIMYFWTKLRPHIKVPYILMTTGSDGNTPFFKPDYVQDPLLINWYGTNPHFDRWKSNEKFMEKRDKFRPMHLGLSGFNHPKQEQHVLPYLQLTNFSNPFLDLDFETKPFQGFDKDVFVHFSTTRQHRLDLWNVLCDSASSEPTTSASCSPNNAHMAIDKLYSEMSKYRFAISPPGAGWDCYRTYEILFLGLIPIIEERGDVTRQLFKDMPVILMPRMSKAKGKQDFVTAIQDYLKSDAYLKADFHAGWKRLFLEYNRRQLLKDSGRDKEILHDDNGNEYFQAYRYSVVVGNEAHRMKQEAVPKEVICSDPQDCLTPEEERHIGGFEKAEEHWYEHRPPPLQGEDETFVNLWKHQQSQKAKAWKKYT